MQPKGVEEKQERNLFKSHSLPLPLYNIIVKVTFCSFKLGMVVTPLEISPLFNCTSNLSIHECQKNKMEYWTCMNDLDAHTYHTYHIYISSSLLHTIIFSLCFYGRLCFDRVSISYIK